MQFTPARRSPCRSSATEKTLDLIEASGQETVAFNHPIGVEATDRFLMEVARLTGKPSPIRSGRTRQACRRNRRFERAHPCKKFALFGDPDLTLGLTGFLLELGAEPVHILSTNGGQAWREKVEALLAASPFGKSCHVYSGKDLWHMRSLLFTEPVRLFDWQHLRKVSGARHQDTADTARLPNLRPSPPSSFPGLGISRWTQCLIKILDKIFDHMDQTTNEVGKTDYSFDIIR